MKHEHVSEHKAADHFPDVRKMVSFGSACLTASAKSIRSFTRNARSSFGETVLGQPFLAGPCFFPSLAGVLPTMHTHATSLKKKRSGFPERRTSDAIASVVWDIPHFKIRMSNHL